MVRVFLFVVPRVPGVRSLHAEQRILHYLRGEAGEEEGEEGWRKKDLVDEGVMAVDDRSESLMLRPELLGE